MIRCDLDHGAVDLPPEAQAAVDAVLVAQLESDTFRVPAALANTRPTPCPVPPQPPIGWSLAVIDGPCTDCRLTKDELRDLKFTDCIASTDRCRYDVSGVRLTHENGVALDLQLVDGLDTPLQDGCILTRNPAWSQAQWWSVYSLLGWLRHAGPASNFISI